MNSDQTQTQEQKSPVLRFDIFTLFPDMFVSPLAESILKRAKDRGIIEIAIHDLRDWTYDKHRTADDTPYGGGAGMVMKAPPIVEAVEAVLGEDVESTRIIMLSAGGKSFTQAQAVQLSSTPRIALICGHYEGIDDRVRMILNCEEWSIGDFVLTGGELPAMVMIDAVTRLIPGVIDAASIGEESFEDGLVEYPHFTRPLVYRGYVVPEILRSGHHANIQKWRREQSRVNTARNRPELLSRTDPEPSESIHTSVPRT